MKSWSNTDLIDVIVKRNNLLLEEIKKLREELREVKLMLILNKNKKEL
jgi:hypothetical protein